MQEDEKLRWFCDVIEGRAKGRIFATYREKNNEGWRFQVMADNTCFYISIGPQYLSCKGVDLDKLKVGQEVVRCKPA